MRNNIHYRNHLRLWKAPVTYRGIPMAIGQISRDICNRITTKSPNPTTHRIDPDVDETRASLVHDLLDAQSLALFGMAGWVGDPTADCVFAADDVSAIVNVVDDPLYSTPGNPDANGDRSVTSADVVADLLRVFL